MRPFFDTATSTPRPMRGIWLAAAYVCNMHPPRFAKLPRSELRGRSAAERLGASYGLLAICLSICLDVFLGSGRAFAEPATASSTSSLDVFLQQGQAQQRQLEQLEQQLVRSQAVQAEREKQRAQLAQTIEQLKSQPPGVARDLSLNEKLAQAQAFADELAQAQKNDRQMILTLHGQRRQLVATCDHILDAAANKDAALHAAQRFFWLQLRTTQVEALLAEDHLGAAPKLVPSEISRGSQPTSENTLDDPQALHERADLLRDSADKLHREVQRLQERSQELQRRQRLRERASRVDEDLFAEQSSSRRSLGPASNASLSAPRVPSAAMAGTAADAATTAAAASSTIRSGPNPATLDGLRRIDGPFDTASKLQALSRTQGDLEALAANLLRRASLLDERARALSRQK